MCVYEWRVEVVEGVEKAKAGGWVVGKEGVWKMQWGKINGWSSGGEEVGCGEEGCWGGR